MACTQDLKNPCVAIGLVALFHAVEANLRGGMEIKTAKEIKTIAKNWGVEATTMLGIAENIISALWDAKVYSISLPLHLASEEAVRKHCPRNLQGWKIMRKVMKFKTYRDFGNRNYMLYSKTGKESGWGLPINSDVDKMLKDIGLVRVD
jgi:hypothetical protein